MVTVACAVGRIGDQGHWIGFALGPEDGYLLVIGGGAVGPRTAVARADDLLSLAIAYFEEALPEPPEELAATHADIGALVRHLATTGRDEGRLPALYEAVDAVDDGLAPDVVVGRLSACLEDGEDPVARLERRAAGLIAG